MSQFWESYKKRVEEGAAKLSSPPKDVDQNILWLKAYVVDRMDKEGIKKFVGKSGEDSFGFREEFVNILMHYAFDAGQKQQEDYFKRTSADMKKALDNIKDALDDINWIEYNDEY